MTGARPPVAASWRRRAKLGFAGLLALTFVSGAAHGHGGAVKERLLSVERWLLLINNELDDETTERIAQSPYDMVVVDDIATLPWNARIDMRAKVAALKQRAGGQRLVLSYLNVGQAEDYRIYFQEAWKARPPRWIIGADPEGWAGNYPTAYWNAEWQEILVGPRGLVRQIAGEGFDGAYLDWVAGYFDEMVLGRARADGVNARAEMIRLLLRVAETARSINPDFVLVLQNVSDLVDEPAIVSAADAFVQEGIWFEGAVDDNPVGDCPLPRTPGEASSSAYRATLPEACRRAYAEGRIDILNYAQESEAVPPLSRAHQAGLAVFTVDYAVQPGNVAEAVRRSRARGFKPFVGVRALKQYQEPPF